VPSAGVGPSHPSDADRSRAGTLALAATGAACTERGWER
jgi:hypothetical protein